MPRVEVALNTNVAFSIECEACGHAYQAVEFLEVRKNLIDDLLNRDLKTKFNNILSNIRAHNYNDLQNNMKCPQCGYTQSWNIPASINGVADKIGSVIGLAVGGLSAISYLIQTGFRDRILGTLFIALLIFSFSYYFIYLILKFISRPIVKQFYNPNKDKTVEKVIYPTLH